MDKWSIWGAIEHFSYFLNDIGAAISVIIAEICLLFLISKSIIKFQKQFHPNNE